MEWLELKVQFLENIDNDEQKERSLILKIQITDGMAFRINGQMITLHNTQKSIMMTGSLDIVLTKYCNIVADDQFNLSYSETRLDVCDINLYARFNPPILTYKTVIYV